MYVVTATDHLSGDTEPQTLDTFATVADALEHAAGLIEDAIAYDDLGPAEIENLAAAETAAKRFRQNLIWTATVDGFEVAIATEEQN